MGKYAIHGGMRGSERLEVLSQAMDSFTRPFVLSADIQPNWHCLDMGCGGGQVTAIIAEQLGSEGSVLGIDLDSDNIAHARELVEKQSLNQASFSQQDVHHLVQENHYDLIYTRFLLSHLSTAPQLLKTVWKTLAPGGQLLIEDTHFAGHFCYPACPAFDEYVSLYEQLLLKRNGDANIGPKLPQLLAEAGFKDIDVQVVQPVHMSGQSKLMAEITLSGIAAALVEEGIATTRTIELFLAELASFRQRDDTLMSMPRVFQVRCRKE